jgi:signal transduction histidine kinase
VEYSFNKPEWIDPERFIEGYITKKGNGWLNFKPSVTWDKGNNQAKADLKDPSTGQLILKKGDAVDMLLFPKDALERVFNNIVFNAQAHGFDDSTRKDYELRFSWHTDGIALIVEIENNGTAIPSDRDTASLLEYGVSSALHQNGHNGIGCNEIDDIMRRYDGKVEIVSSPEKKFTVKYVLTFNRSNIVKFI